MRESKTKEKDLLITMDGCKYCEEAIDLLKNSIENGDIEVIPVETPYGQYLIDRYEIDTAPTLLNKTKNETKKCSINFDKKTIECEDGTEKKIG